jgi:hypothetical protein
MRNLSLFALRQIITDQTCDVYLSNRHAIAPGLFALVHEFVCTDNQGLGRILREKQRPANRYCDCQPISIDVEPRMLHKSSHFFGGSPQITFILHIMQNGNKFFAAPTTGRIAGAQGIVHGLGNHAQNLIASAMPINVVELLKGIYVHKEQAGQTRVGLGLSERCSQASIEMPAVANRLSISLATVHVP